MRHTPLTHIGPIRMHCNVCGTQFNAGPSQLLMLEVSCPNCGEVEVEPLPTGSIIKPGENKESDR